MDVRYNAFAFSSSDEFNIYIVGWNPPSLIFPSGGVEFTPLFLSFRSLEMLRGETVYDMNDHMARWSAQPQDDHQHALYEEESFHLDNYSL